MSISTKFLTLPVPISPIPQPSINYITDTQQSHNISPYIQNVMPSYVHKYPQIIDAVQGIQSIVSEWKPETLQGSFELEARFGRWQGQYFESGVSKAFVEKILEMFQSYSQWSTVTEWEETHDYFYHAEDKSKGLIRTTASFHTEGQDGRRSIVTEHIRKHVYSKLDYQYKSNNPTPNKYQYDLRVNLNFEEKVPDQELPSIVNPSSMRIKSRKSYYYKSENFPSTMPLWKFDITRSWTAANRSDAEMKQKNGETIYEIELECLNPRALMVSPKHDCWYVACSLLMKMRDFITYANNVQIEDLSNQSLLDFKWEPNSTFNTSN